MGRRCRMVVAAVYSLNHSGQQQPQLDRALPFRESVFFSTANCDRLMLIATQIRLAVLAVAILFKFSFTFALKLFERRPGGGSYLQPIKCFASAKLRIVNRANLARTQEVLFLLVFRRRPRAFNNIFLFESLNTCRERLSRNMTLRSLFHCL